MDRTVATSALTACFVANAGAGSPRVCGGAARQLTALDIDMIAQVLHERGSPWLIEVIEAAQTSPALLLVSAYLAPTSASPRLRRGQAIRLSKYLDQKEPPLPGWRETPGSFEYAQVRLTSSHEPRACDAPQGWEQPFGVEGNIADADVVALIQLVKGSPHKSAVTTNADGSMSIDSWTIDGSNRILSVESGSSGNAVVRTEEQRGAGQLIELTRDGSGVWSVVRVWQWNA